MKLRIRGNSIRFRLQRSEVLTLLEHGRVEECALLGIGPSERLTYRVELSDSVSAIETTWHDGCLSVLLPRAMAIAWGHGDELCLEATQRVAGEQVLRILVEKDLACVTPRPGEDDHDAYPNPAKSC